MFIPGANTADVAVADLDGDGNLDVIAGNIRNLITLTILYGTAAGDFEYRVIVPLFGTFDATLDVDDLNNDGRPDIVFADSIRNRIGTMMNLGSRQFSVPVITNPPDPPNGLGEFVSVEIGDFDGDGGKDVVPCRDNPTNDSKDWRNSTARNIKWRRSRQSARSPLTRQSTGLLSVTRSRRTTAFDRIEK
jgi:hypothetical protein